jgi:hypothetical protein
MAETHAGIKQNLMARKQRETGKGRGHVFTITFKVMTQ